jgi:hypothetical protein
MKYMFEPFKRFKEFTSEIEKQIGNSIKIIWPNRGSEYLNQVF